MSKDEILAGYLNVVEFSRQVYGVGAAARAYFGTTPDKLTVAQGALLAGMANNPSTYDPWSNPERALDRRNFVVDKMVENRKLSTEDAEEVKAEPLGVLPDGPDKPAANCVGAGPENGFFCQYVAGLPARARHDQGRPVHRRLHDPHHAGPRGQPRRQGVRRAAGQQDRGERRQHAFPGETRQGPARGGGAGRQPGLRAGRRGGQTEFALPSAISNVTGTGSSYKVFTAAAAMERGVAGIQDTVQSPSSHTSDVFVGGGEQCPTVAQGHAGLLRHERQ